jgi:hypothetical protein
VCWGRQRRQNKRVGPKETAAPPQAQHDGRVPFSPRAAGRCHSGQPGAATAGVRSTHF